MFPSQVRAVVNSWIPKVRVGTPQLNVRRPIYDLASGENPYEACLPGLNRESVRQRGECAEGKDVSRVVQGDLYHA